MCVGSYVGGLVARALRSLRRGPVLTRGRVSAVSQAAWGEGQGRRRARVTEQNGKEWR